MYLVGELGAKLSLYGKQQFDSDLATSGKQFTGLGDVARKVTDGIGVGIRTAATTTLALTAATAALTTSVFRGGVAYNTLQQTSRAALKTLLGSAEAVNAQMDQLDAFARTSPFSKSVFISAQQQLLGFGLEAQKVIPYLDSIQQAVAAVGGSNDDIAGLVEIIAKIRSSAKITAEDLNMFGGRGVDAAALIGSQMGVTGQEIRDQITAGTLDANAALDALAAGMQAKFGGSAANVKTTISGTVDRIKAATREIGATLAQPFVTQSGGGLFVTWGNQVADVLRAILAQTDPVVQIVTTRLAPAFATVTELLDHAGVVVKSWDASSLETTLNEIGVYAPAVAGLAAGFAAIGLKGVPVLGALLSGLNPVVVGLVALAATSPEIRSAAGELFDSFEPLLPVLADLVKTGLTGLNLALPVAADGLRIVARVAKPVVDLVAAIPTPVLATAAAFLGLHRIFTQITGPGTAASKVIQSIAQNIEASKAVADSTGGGVTVFGAAARSAGTAVTGLGTALKATFLTNPVGIAITVAAAAVGLLMAAFTANAQKIAEQKELTQQLKDTLNETTDSYTALTRETIRKGLTDKGVADQALMLGISMETVTDAAMGNTAAQVAVTKAMKVYKDGLGSGSQAQLTYNATVLGFQSAIDFQRKALEDAQKEQKRYRLEVQEANAALTDGERSNRRFNDALSIARDTTKDAETRVKALKQALDELKGGTLSATEAQAKLSETNLDLAEGLAQTDEAGNKLWQSTADGAGKIDLSTRSGLAFQEQMSRSADAMLAATQTAYDLAISQGKTLPEATAAATAAGQQYNDTLRATLKAAGLTDDQIAGLISTYGYVPSVVGTLVTDNGTISSVDQQALGLIGKLGTIAEGATLTIADPNAPDVLKRLEDLGYHVEHLPDGQISITQQGADAVQAALDELTRPRTVSVDVFYTGDPAGAPGAPLGSYGNGLGVLAPPTPNANGAAYLRGVQAFANGGLPVGIYPGRPGGIHKLAEPETIAEAYISKKPGQESRNVRVLETAADWFGMQIVPKDRVSAFADGGIAQLLSSLPGFTSTAAEPGQPGPSFSIGPITAPAGADLNAFADLIVARIRKLMRGR